ncbi:hypothetical protein PAEH1_06535 [Paenalcaligenes hominis]|uniref:Uncharacterized protein n=1 Tax=Paenalcaligenes hominis TaxID=643674 RepID=A0A1U9JZT2_9BURK|nr:DUF6776 family protein [Paenalcaligenes hominis]AQS51295.1 hypothetical protein PAEH1_06535 [Paenalcaligenes hominis]
MTTPTSTPTLRWGWLLIAVLVGLLIGAGSAWYWQQQRLESLKQVHSQWLGAQEQLQQAQLQNQSLHTQLTLEQATQDALQQRLTENQRELGRLQEQLAFYEHLLPLSGAGPVQVRGLDLEPQAETLRYKLLLQRPAALPRFNGHIQFTAHGHLNGDSVNIVLTTAGEEPSTTADIEFDQFLRTTGLLAVPDGLRIEAVTLHIYQGKQLRATHKIDLVPSSAAAADD